MTASQLAGLLEVSVRTVYRDVEALSGAGVPVYAEAGRGGGIRLMDGYRARLNGLSPEEAEALLVAGASGPVSELGLGTVFAAAQTKLLAALPQGVAERALAAHQRFHIDSSRWFRAAGVPPHLPTVAAGVWGDRKLAVTYRHSEPGDDARRVLDPLGLVLKAGAWYLVGRRDGEIRTYRVWRIAEAELLDEPAHRPAAFDLGSWWADSVTSYEASCPRFEVELIATERVVRALRGHHQRPGATESGRLRPTTVAFDDADAAFRELLCYAGEVEVVAPADLRQRIRAAAEAILDRYSDNRMSLLAGVSGG
jgi:predicted DNA-binding transcriptional regulator YafY